MSLRLIHAHATQRKKKKEGLTVLFVSELTHAELWTGLTFQMFTSKHKAPWLPG